MEFKTIFHPHSKKEYNLTSIYGIEILNGYLTNIMNDHENNGGFSFTRKRKLYRKKNRYNTLKSKLQI